MTPCLEIYGLMEYLNLKPIELFFLVDKRGRSQIAMPHFWLGWKRNRTLIMSLTEFIHMKKWSMFKIPDHFRIKAKTHKILGLWSIRENVQQTKSRVATPTGIQILKEKDKKTTLKHWNRHKKLQILPSKDIVYDRQIITVQIWVLESLSVRKLGLKGKKASSCFLNSEKKFEVVMHYFWNLCVDPREPKELSFTAIFSRK